MFDKIYALADGMCIYQGTPGNIVPYLQQLTLDCPLNYNPGDFRKFFLSKRYHRYIFENS